MKILIPAVVAIGLGAVAATIIVGSRLAEPKVVADPYEAGLHWDADQASAARPDCAVSAGPCTKASGGGVTLTLEVSPRPVRAMTDLVFVVSSSTPLGGDAELALTMPGMYMGDNRVRLARGADGRLAGKGVIVRCPSGRRTWSAAVTARSATGEPLAATFTFDLAE